MQKKHHDRFWFLFSKLEIEADLSYQDLMSSGGRERVKGEIAESI